MNLTREQFIAYIDAVRVYVKSVKALYAAGVEIREDVQDAFGAPLEVLLEVVFSTVKNDAINWWLFDKPNGAKADPTEAHMWDRDGKPIPLTNAGELYDYLCTLDEE